MIIVNEESLEKLKDLSFKPKYNTDTGIINRYVLSNVMSVEETANPFNDIAAPIWKVHLSRYADTSSIVDTLFDMFSLGICKKVIKESDLLTGLEEVI